MMARPSLPIECVPDQTSQLGCLFFSFTFKLGLVKSKAYLLYISRIELFLAVQVSFPHLFFLFCSQFLVLIMKAYGFFHCAFSRPQRTFVWSQEQRGHIPLLVGLWRKYKKAWKEGRKGTTATGLWAVERSCAALSCVRARGYVFSLTGCRRRCTIP